MKRSAKSDMFKPEKKFKKEEGKGSKPQGKSFGKSQGKPEGKSYGKPEGKGEGKPYKKRDVKGESKQHTESF
jgi:pumilio homology domain family member 6